VLKSSEKKREKRGALRIRDACTEEGEKQNLPVREREHFDNKKEKKTTGPLKEGRGISRCHGGKARVGRARDIPAVLEKKRSLSQKTTGKRILARGGKGPPKQRKEKGAPRTSGKKGRQSPPKKTKVAKRGGGRASSRQKLLFRKIRTRNVPGIARRNAR